MGDEEAADDGDAEWASGFCAIAEAEGDGESADEGGHGGHGDGAEANAAGVEDGITWGLAVEALGIEGEVDEDDGIFFDDADEHEDADEAVDIELHFEEEEGEESSEACAGEAGEDGDGVDEAFVEDTEDEIDDEDGHEEEEADA